MNKKYLLFGVGGILLLSLVVAVTYYDFFTVSFNVVSAVTLSGDTEQELGDVYSGETYRGEPITITNNAPSLREVTLTDDAPSEIDVEYVSTLTLSQKVVELGESNWELTGDTASVEYTVVGDEFTAEIVSGAKDGYVLVYYKDNSDRFSSPAKAIGVDSVSGNLPYTDDANVDEYDYCATGEYDNCHGAKIWYVPSTAVDGEGNVDWGQASSFLFETNLIQFSSDGEIIMYPESSLVVTPIYTIGESASGEYTIKTTVA